MPTSGTGICAGSNPVKLFTVYFSYGNTNGKVGLGASFEQ
jgi:hypothetical protein